MKYQECHTDFDEKNYRHVPEPVARAQTAVQEQKADGRHVRDEERRQGLDGVLTCGKVEIFGEESHERRKGRHITSDKR